MLQVHTHTAARTSCFNKIRSHHPPLLITLLWSSIIQRPNSQGLCAIAPSTSDTAEGLSWPDLPSHSDPASTPLLMGLCASHSKCLHYSQKIIFIGAASECLWSVSFGQFPTSKASKCLPHTQSPEPGHSRVSSNTVDEWVVNMPKSQSRSCWRSLLCDPHQPSKF